MTFRSQPASCKLGLLACLPAWIIRKDRAVPNVQKLNQVDEAEDEAPKHIQRQKASHVPAHMSVQGLSWRQPKTHRLRLWGRTR